MQEVFHLARKVAPTQTTVLITGESGTGKEVVARAIHHYSQASGKVFLPVNCAAIPETLLESQLFGHVRGAFTGAVTAQEGLFARASGGTIFLDEIGDLPTGLQSKLLRAIEAKEILPVGSTHPVTVDVRIIAATNRELRSMVEDGHVPRGPLLPAERRADRPAAAARAPRGHPGADRVPRPPAQPRDEALLPRRRQRHAEAPHVAALEGQRPRARQRHRARDDPRRRRMDHASPTCRARCARETRRFPPVADDLRDALRAYEKIHIENVLRRLANDKRQAADALGLSLSSLYRKMNELGIPLD